MELRPNKGFQPVLEQDHPYIFIDACMQTWPDADFEKIHQHGVTSIAVTSMRPHAELDGGLEDLMYWRVIARKYPNITVVDTAEDIRDAKRDGKLALLLAAQGGDFIGNHLHRVEAFYRLGLRMLIPAYNTSNFICDGCLDRTNGGLTRFGELVVDECNRVGMVLDCTHVGHRSTLEIIERSVDPVVFSHSNPKAMSDNPRNIADDQIQACAAKGGVIGLCPWGPLVMRNDQTTWPTVDDFINIVDYVAQMLGSVDNIGIGTDMSLGTYPPHERDPWGEPKYPDVAGRYAKYVTGEVLSPKRSLDGFHAYAHVTNLIERFEARGYSADDVAKILGENLLRAYGQVWK